MLLIACVPDPIPEEETTIDGSDIAVQINGVLPSNGYIVLEDASGNTIENIAVSAAGLFTFTRDNYAENTNYPFSIRFFQDSDSDGMYTAASESGSSFFLTYVYLDGQRALAVQYPVQTIDRYQGTVVFHSDMGSEAGKRHIYVRNVRKNTERLLPVSGSNTFDFYDNVYSSSGEMFVYALYDANGNGTADLLTDFVSILVSPSTVTNNSSISKSLISLSSFIDTSVFDAGSGVSFFVEVDDRNAQGSFFSSLTNNENMNVFIPGGDAIEIHLYSIPNSVTDLSYKSIRQTSTYHGPLLSYDVSCPICLPAYSTLV